MQTIDEAREHCGFVGKGIEKMVADGEDQFMVCSRNSFVLCRF